ncbi:MAG: heavy metal translocating P-type ATPase [Elainella sp. Prado103]|jgi:Cu2+-exporting ATPase|nr:heavy metal translocating P-type ATPase [Elainella sp. Prado103]
MTLFGSQLVPDQTSPSLFSTSSLTYSLVHQIPGRIRFRVWGLQLPIGLNLQTVLSQIPGITQVRVNLAAQSLIIHYQASVSIVEPITQLLQQYSQAASLASDDLISDRSVSIDLSSSHLSDSPIVYTAEEGQWASLKLPATAALLSLLCRLPRLAILRPLATLAVLVAAFPVVQRAIHSLWQQRRLNIDCLDLLALSLSGWQGKLFTPAMVITLHELGDVIREQTARSTELQTTHLMDAISRFAWVKVGDQAPQQIPGDQVQVGDTVVVYPGEQIPVDGTVIQGEAIVDQQSLTGEAMPVVKRLGDLGFASTLVRSGQLYLRAERVGSQTRAAASLELLQKAPVYDTRMANYAEKLADRLILPSLLLAAMVLLASRDPARAAAILTLDFVTGIRISIPTAFLSALNHTTRHGVLVRSGRTLEQLAEVDTIVFDKTGTLTQGTIAITGVSVCEAGYTAEQVLRLAAAAEQRLNHPVAEAIVQFAQSQQLHIPDRGEWQYEVGLGVRAQIEGQEVLVGSERFLQQEAVEWGNWTLERADRLHSLIYVACDRRFQGAIQYSDPLRPESRRLIQSLQQDYNIDLHLLTGDQVQRALQVAEELGIPSRRVYAEAFPEQKAKMVRELHRSGRTVAFVGDGLNDSVALAYADVSVSFERGSEIARETADVVLMNNNLLDLLEVITIAQQTHNLIDQNTTLVVLPNLIALGLATTVGLNPLIATAIHNGSAIIAGINSLRPLLQHQLQNRI